MRDVPARQVWWAFVVAGVRSKVGATLLVLGLGVSAWLFATAHVTLGLVEFAILALSTRVSRSLSESCLACEEGPGSANRAEDAHLGERPLT